jgi:serine/threonine protein kinase
MAFLNEYEVLKKLGEGGFASVYKAHYVINN